ncbi:MAG: putative lipid II flippase FtsW, partial [Actinomycetota bacterium]|nr:putative lipid II flippase FtsW [Actinomycetota bacterium]
MTLLSPVPAPRPAAGAEGPAARVSLLQRPTASYYLLLVTTGLLLVIGVVMVFSASSVQAYAVSGRSWSTGLKQALFVAVGVPAMLIASRLPVRVYRLAAYPLLLLSLALLVLVLVVGRSAGGAQSWIALGGGFNLQPAELGKLALVLWGADLLTRKQRLLGDWRHLFVPLVPVTCLLLGLVMLQPDLGTSLATVSILVGLLWVVGAPLRWFAGFFVGMVAVAVALAVAEPYRMERLLAFRDPFADAQDTGFQAVQSFYALSSGGWFGLGLGASREKWAGGLPEAHTDFVFAIIGEELGLLGTLTVLALFAVLVYSGVRIAQRACEPFVRLAAAAVTTLLACQALMNMGAVVGLLPITGITLPLVSFGGSSLLVTLASIGMLLSFARAEPGAREALQARRASFAGHRRAVVTAAR